MRAFFERLWRGEPVFFVGVVEIAVQAAILFWPGLDEMTTAGLMFAVRGLGALVARQGAWSPSSVDELRRELTPNAASPAPEFGQSL